MAVIMFFASTKVVCPFCVHFVITWMDPNVTSLYFSSALEIKNLVFSKVLNLDILRLSSIQSVHVMMFLARTKVVCPFFRYTTLTKLLHFMTYLCHIIPVLCLHDYLLKDVYNDIKKV